MASDRRDDSSRADPCLMPSQHKKYLISAGNFFTSGLTIPCPQSLATSQLPCPSPLFGFASPLPQAHGKLSGQGHQPCRHSPPISAHTDRLHCAAVHLTIVQGREGLFKHMQLQLATLGCCSASQHQPPIRLLAYIFMIPIITEQKHRLL